MNPVKPGDTTIGGGGTPGGSVTVTLPDGTVITTPVKPDGTWNVPLPNPAKPGDTFTGTQKEPGKDPSRPVTTTVPGTQADGHTPIGQDVPTTVGKTPDAKDGIKNKDDLPPGTDYTWKDRPDTSTPGDKPATIIVTYPDGSTDEVPVTVKVTNPDDKVSTPPTIKPVKPGDTSIGGGGTPGGSVTVTLPDGTVITTPVKPDGTWNVPLPNPAKPGDTFTGTQTEPGKDPSRPVTTTVPGTQADGHTPIGQDVPTTVGKTPDAKDGIKNKDDLPDGTSITWKDRPDTSTPGDKPATILVTYPDGSTDEVPVTVKVTNPDDKVSNSPSITPIKPGDTTIGGVGTPGGSVTVTLPDGTVITTPVKPDGTWNVPLPNPAKPGDTFTSTQKEPGKDPSAPVKTTVPGTQADEHTPIGQDVPTTVGKTPDAKDGIKNKDDLPDGTSITWKDRPDTSTPGDNPATILVTYPDGSTDEVPVTVKVTNPATQADQFPPKVIPEIINKGGTVDLTDNIANLPELPKGTKVEDVTPVGSIDPNKPGTQTGRIKVTYPDGSSVIVDVPVVVVDNDSLTPITPAKKSPDNFLPRESFDARPSTLSVAGGGGSYTPTYSGGMSSSSPTGKSLPNTGSEAGHQFLGLAGILLLSASGLLLKKKEDRDEL
ncbi:Rib/alpha-like domain-containing protein [Streptococcus suis]